MLLPKIKAMVGVVGVIDTSLRNHNRKEKTMVTESSKSYRYDKISETTVESIHKMAEAGAAEIKAQKPWLDEIDVDQQAYAQACDKFMKTIEQIAGKNEMYWLFEIMLEECFDYIPSARNPFAVRGPQTNHRESQMINPYKMIMEHIQ